MSAPENTADARERLRRACEDAARLYEVRMHAPDGPSISDDNRINGILSLDLLDALGAFDRLVDALAALQAAHDAEQLARITAETERDAARAKLAMAEAAVQQMRQALERIRDAHGNLIVIKMIARAALAGVGEPAQEADYSV